MDGGRGASRGPAWLEQRPEVSVFMQDGKGLVGQSLKKGGRAVQTHSPTPQDLLLDHQHAAPEKGAPRAHERVGRMEGVAEWGQPQPRSAFSRRGIAGRRTRRAQASPGHWAGT